MIVIPNQNDTLNKLESIIVQILQKKGVLSNTHEIGVVERQLSPTVLLVSPTQFDKDAEEISCAQIDGGYRKGDRVLIEYVNGSAHKKFVIAVMQKGFEQAAIDYSKLRDTPARIFRKPQKFDLLPEDQLITSGDEFDEEPIQYTYRIVYDEGSPMQWEENINRDRFGWASSILTKYPPNNMVQFVTYIHRDANRYAYLINESPTGDINI